MHKFREVFHILNRSLRKNAMPQVKDVAGTTVRLLQDNFGTRFQLGTRQSRPITSAPVSRMEGSNVVLSVPK